jgi:hypothetical protein
MTEDILEQGTVRIRVPQDTVGPNAQDSSQVRYRWGIMIKILVMYDTVGANAQDCSQVRYWWG